MAMFISWVDKTGTVRRVEWHIGENFSDPLGHVVNFQADGDELDLLLDAIDTSIQKMEPNDY